MLYELPRALYVRFPVILPRVDELGFDEQKDTR